MKRSQHNTRHSESREMASERIGDALEIGEDPIMKACERAFKPHKGKPFLTEKHRSGTFSELIFISFAPNWSVSDFYADQTFGNTKIDLSVFPSLRSIGNDEPAQVNKAFFTRFEAIYNNQSFKSELDKATKEEKRIVFTGHSSGAAIAILATLRKLEEDRKLTNTKPNLPPVCVTFGSPLVGNHIFSHATKRENWSRHFIHFVLRYDIVPRISLAPFLSVERTMDPILQVLSQKNRSSSPEPIRYSEFYNSVLKNAAMVTSHRACSLMGSTNLLLETVKNFVVLSPYKPFGTFVLCTGNGKLMVVKNSEAVLQVLFHSAVLSEDGQGDQVAREKVLQHLNYEEELKESFQMQNVVYLDKLEEVPLSAGDCSNNDNDAANVDSALNDLGLGTRARLCLRAAGELEKQKYRNEAKIDKVKAQATMRELEDYKEVSRIQGVGYYDAFKLQKDEKDFKANVKRLVLAGVWDEIIEMLKRYELPDEFEGKAEWVEMGTQFRRLVEPLDIANYYRHLKNEDTGPYMDRARPKRYRYTQRWLEHAMRMETGACSESCFWAEAEELVSKTNKGAFDREFKEGVEKLEDELDRWGASDGILKDVLLEETTFMRWWKGKLPQDCKSGKFMC
ncbi:protein EDS1L-like [Prosopis cineraria]|uniref:protein EDS1L-like n=1 Tax=Prosopis cineraria TaxID=364024 RepID=UPI00240F6400|nr:protein EDS1L-like [Prosopis cineraria]